MTPQEIVDEVLLDLERPDLEQQAFAKLRGTLQSVHGVEVFRRDLVEYVETAPVILDSKTTFTLPPRLKKIIKIEGLDATGAVVGCEFKDLMGRAELRDYWNFKYEQTYSILGSMLNINGISSEIVDFRITYQARPSYEFDALTEVWSTDSWIAVEMPDPILHQLKWQLAKLIAEPELIGSSQQAWLVARAELITQYAGEIV